MSDLSARAAADAVDLPSLEKTLRSSRSLFSFLMSGVIWVLTILAMVPLFSVLWMLIWKGGQRLSVALVTQLPPAAGMVGGGIANAMIGTVLVVILATCISVPVGVLGGVFLAEINPQG